jgi:hypothetical protein
MKHSRIFLALAALVAGAVEAPACSSGEYPTYRYDTLETGALRLIRTQNMGSTQNPFVRVDTVGVYHPSDLQAKLRASLQDSALVFIGRFDSLIPGNSPAPAPLLELDTAPASVYYTAYYRLRIDTVLRGTFPHATPIWIKLNEGAGSCTVSFPLHLNGRFLNASSGFATRADLKMKFDPFPGYSPFPLANWFSGRYLYDPAYPNVMRVDITQILADYPATGIAPRRLPFARAKPTAKTWLPDGREAKGLDARKNPVPVLR